MDSRKTPLDIAREYFPDDTEYFLDHIIWARTGFPSFWHIGKDGDSPEDCFRMQLAQWIDRFYRGFDICERCGIEIVETDNNECNKCKQR